MKNCFKFKITVALISIFIQSSAFAERVELNKILFTAGNTSWSARDQKIYQSVLSEVFKRKKISQYSQTDFNDFLLSRLAEKEANTFDLTYDKVTATEAQKKKIGFSSSEVEAEIQRVAKAITLTEIKESYHNDSKRFASWFDVMKRKYTVKIKTIEPKEL